jgi:hypothetical protein
VQRAAIADHLPVRDAGCAHLLFESDHLIGRRQRIVGAGADQQARLHFAGCCRRLLEVARLSAIPEHVGSHGGPATMQARFMACSFRPNPSCTTSTPGRLSLAVSS